jgi:Deacetylase PdaC
MKLGIVVLGALALTAAAPVPHKVVRDTPALDFSYVWPAEAVAIPALDLRFYTEAKKALTEAQANAREDQQLAKQQKRDFNQHDYSMQWTTAGQTPRLLSLQRELGTFEGGAHPNTVYGSLLWDRSLKREIKIDSLFLRPGAFAAVTRTRYCAALNAERNKRREGEKLDLAEFNACPKYSELAIALVDKNKNGHFDTIDFVASPYTAGPYVEGEYSITVPVTSQLIAGIKPEYRNSFERQRQ